MRRFALMLLSPLLCLALLGGMWADARTHVQPADAEPFHQRAKALIESLPYQLGGWIGRDDDIPPAAVKLLHPNCIISRSYVNPRQIDRRAGLLIVQCRDSRDMLGHFPPICYPAHGMTLVSQQPRDWTLGNLTIPGVEYQFSQNDGPETHQMIVYNFMVVPGVGIVRDMDGVSAAAADYQQRYFGAAQFQMTFSADYSQAERDRIFTALLLPNTLMIETLKSGGLR